MSNTIHTFDYMVLRTLLSHPKENGMEMIMLEGLFVRFMKRLFSEANY